MVITTTKIQTDNFTCMLKKQTQFPANIHYLLCGD